MAAALPLLWTQLQLVSDIISTMDQSVNPCENFYKFSCGNYQTRVNLSDDQSSMMVMDEINKRIVNELRDLLETDHSSIDWSTPSASLVKTYYQSCTNVTSLETLGTAPLKNVLSKYGGWPVFLGKDWKSADFNWIWMNAILTRQFGMSPILDFSIKNDYKNSTKSVLHVDQPDLGLGQRDYYVNKNHSKLLDKYLQYMIRSAVQLGIPESTAKDQMGQVLEFEIELAEITDRDEDRRDYNILYNPMTVAALKKKYPKIDFTQWFKISSDLGFHIDDTEVINVDSPAFLNRLPAILAKFPPRTVANYQLWRLVSMLNRLLAPSLRENYRQYLQDFSGTLKFKPRWEECINDVLQKLGIPIGAIYVKKYFSLESKSEVDTMASTIRQVMKSTIDQTKWMDDTTKKFAQAKLAAMIQNMAFPSDQINNETWLMREFNGVKLDKDRYMENVLSIWTSNVNRMLDNFQDPIDRNEWSEGFTVVNAWYSSSKNKMTVPAGILGYPLYLPSAPHYINYGRIGAAIGHEITHGFDDKGRQFDANGNFNLWWTNKTLAEFKKGSKCFINQYSHIKDATTGLYLNGEATQGENIADNGGLNLAYKAYHMRIANLTRPEKGLKNYTTEQMFFVAFGQLWCELIRPQSLNHQIVTDSHSPTEYRVNVVLQNNKEFSKAFNCPASSPMNPEKKCKIW